MNDHIIRQLDELEALYGEASETSRLKEVDYIHPAYAAFIAASPFVILATGADGTCDASPRGDPPGFVAIADDRTLLMPDRRGNNRLDSLRNILANPAVALLFLIPGIGETLRVNGRADISVDPALCNRFVHEGKPPRTVLVIHVESVYFQCSKALVRSRLWDPATQRPRSDLPSTGAIIAAVTAGRIDGKAYDAALPARLASTLY